MTKSDAQNLLNWFNKNKRDLPWRKSRDPYRVWISETMLQQTTTTAVLGFYERFLTRFENLEALATAPLEDVFKYWAGLGYYSRARNLHKAAKELVANGGFAKTYVDLMKLPGFGPYTSRAVSSIAFSEAVGVVDGNVIRVLSRKENLPTQWWSTAGRNEYQIIADKIAQSGPSHEINQALMELGSQICRPKSPHCTICPWLTTCASKKAGNINLRPPKRPRRASEIWKWSPIVNLHKDQVLLVKNKYAPFLKSSWFLPGQCTPAQTRPQRYDFRHSITHHDIFVQLRVKKASISIRKSKKSATNIKDTKWVKYDELSRYAPTSLMKKAVQHAIQKIGDN
jgi:A/G-specific adenine glycosylase